MLLNSGNQDDKFSQILMIFWRKFTSLKSKFESRKKKWLDFYVLACSSAIFGPILDFKVSADSWDPGDFKSDLKKVK